LAFALHAHSERLPVGPPCPHSRLGQWFDHWLLLWLRQCLRWLLVHWRRWRAGGRAAVTAAAAGISGFSRTGAGRADIGGPGGGGGGGRRLGGDSEVDCLPATNHTDAGLSESRTSHSFRTQLEYPSFLTAHPNHCKIRLLLVFRPFQVLPGLHPSHFIRVTSSETLIRVGGSAAPARWVHTLPPTRPQAPPPRQ
jgi:hypothetical protein